MNITLFPLAVIGLADVAIGEWHARHLDLRRDVHYRPNWNIHNSIWMIGEVNRLITYYSIPYTNEKNNVDLLLSRLKGPDCCLELVGRIGPQVESFVWFVWKDDVPELQRMSSQSVLKAGFGVHEVDRVILSVVTLNAKMNIPCGSASDVFYGNVCPDLNAIGIEARRAHKLNIFNSEPSALVRDERFSTQPIGFTGRDGRPSSEPKRENNKKYSDSTEPDLNAGHTTGFLSRTCRTPLFAKVGFIGVPGFLTVGLINAGLGTLLLGRASRTPLIGSALIAEGGLCLMVGVFAAWVFGTRHPYSEIERKKGAKDYASPNRKV